MKGRRETKGKKEAKPERERKEERKGGGMTEMELTIHPVVGGGPSDCHSGEVPSIDTLPQVDP